MNEMMFCPECGMKIEAGASFCSACGAKVESQAPAEKSPWPVSAECLEVTMRNRQTLEDATGRMEHNELAVGRSDIQSKLVLKGDPAISRTHFVLSCKDGMLYARDTSSHGTLVNDQLLDPTVPLKQGDVLSVGNSSFIISWKKIKTWAAR